MPGTLAGLLEAAYAGEESPAVLISVDGVEHELVASPLPTHPAVGGRRW